eukprot:Pgem_evm1s11364
MKNNCKTPGSNSPLNLSISPLVDNPIKCITPCHRRFTQALQNCSNKATLQKDELLNLHSSVSFLIDENFGSSSDLSHLYQDDTQFFSEINIRKTKAEVYLDILGKNDKLCLKLTGEPSLETVRLLYDYLEESISP